MTVQTKPVILFLSVPPCDSETVCYTFDLEMSKRWVDSICICDRGGEFLLSPLVRGFVCQVVLLPTKLSIPVTGFCWGKKEQRKHVSVTGLLVIQSYQGLPKRALKQLGKMKIWDYPRISITVFVLFQTPINIHSWFANAVEIYKATSLVNVSNLGPT